MKEEHIPPRSSPQTKQVWKEKVTPSPSKKYRIWVSIIETG
jgi:hypothetical protein